MKEFYKSIIGDKSFYRNGILLFTVFFVLIFRLISMFYGLPVDCDEAFNMLQHSLMLENIEYVNDVSGVTNCYLTSFIGAVTIKTFGNYLLTIRILQAINDTILAFAIFKIFELYFSKIPISLSVIIATVTLYDKTIREFYYNSFSVMLLSVSIAFLLYGILYNEKIKIVLSGVFMGLCFFARIPNCVYLLFPVVCYLLICRLNGCKSHFFNCCLNYMFGSAIGLLLVISIMIYNGHLSVFIESIFNLLGEASDVGESHGLVNMLVVIYGWVKVFIIVSILLFVYPLVHCCLHKYNIKSTFANCCLFAFSLVFVLYIYSFYFQHHDLTFNRYKLLYLYIAFTYFVLLSLVMCNNRIKIISVISLFIVYVIPFGCDLYIVGVGYYAMFFAYPVMFGVLYDSIKQNYFFVNLYNLLIIALVPYFFYTSFYHCFSSRNATICNDKMKYIKVEENLACTYNDKIKFLNMYDNEISGKLLLVQSCNDLWLEYFYDCKPYNIRPFPYSSNVKVEKVIKKKALLYNKLPIVFFTKENDYLNSYEYKFVNDRIRNYSKHESMKYLIYIPN